MGSTLNRAHDNLCFTLMCKRPRWLPARLAGPRPSIDIMQALEVVGRLVTGRRLDRPQLGLLADAAADMAAWGHDAKGAGKGPPGFGIAARALDAAPAAPGWWGWKEPNSHLVLPELAATFPGLRYVHVLRHPLDMAFSSNVNQLTTWGPAFGITPKEGRDLPTANAQLEWWLASTAMALETGSALGRRFAILHFEDLCDDPTRLIAQTLEALEIGLEPGSAAGHVEPPDSIGRWRDHPWDKLDPELLPKVRALGYDIPFTRA